MSGHADKPRPALDSDAEAIGTVWLRSRLASVPFIPEPIHSGPEVRRWVAQALIPNGGTWVVESGGGVVAMMTLHKGWIEQLYVDPDHFNQGAGTRLLNHAKRLFPDGLDLWTFQSNIGARRFYEIHGFTPVEESSGDNEERSPDVRYHWDGR
jgi:GNAT superfamily N-acetyltransferase